MSKKIQCSRCVKKYEDNDRLFNHMMAHHKGIGRDAEFEVLGNIISTGIVALVVFDQQDLVMISFDETYEELTEIKVIKKILDLARYRPELHVKYVGTFFQSTGEMLQHTGRDKTFIWYGTGYVEL